MKKVMMLLSAVLFSTCAFALNAQVSMDELCRPGKVAFEQQVASADEYQVAQKIMAMDEVLIKLGEHSWPVAACYATYKVNGQSVVDFAKAHKNDYRSVTNKALADFAVRVGNTATTNDVETICAVGKDAFENKVANAVNDFAIAQQVVKLEEALKAMTDEEALPAAACFNTYQAEGKSVVEFAQEHQNDYRNVVNKDLASFANRFTHNLENLSL